MNGIKFTIDGKELTGSPGQSIMEAADNAGIYIPRLCYFKDLIPYGGCRVCVVSVNGRIHSSCTQPVVEGMVVENDTEEMNKLRRDVVDMLFAEGNHICPSCEKSGNCELQAVAYKLGITAPRFPLQFPRRDVDASHPDIYLDRNRCILCSRCVRASRDLDGKSVFGFINRGFRKTIAVNALANLADTRLDITDKVVDVCPVGSILKKKVGFSVPVGKRKFDKKEIGEEVKNPGVI